MSESFHAHLYFMPHQRSQVLTVQERFGGFLHEFPAGPHPLPMLTLVFGAHQKTEITEFITCRAPDISVLIHVDTGDDLWDHTCGAEWIGEKLNLDFNHFERIKYEKSARIFPES